MYIEMQISNNKYGHVKMCNLLDNEIQYTCVIFLGHMEITQFEVLPAVVIINNRYLFITTAF